MNHTALPWTFEPLTCDDDRGMGYISGADGREISHHGVSERWKHENLANAAFIVRSVNCHEELVAALKIAKKFMEAASDWNFDEAEIDGEMKRTYRWIDVIDAALALAEEKP